MPLLDIWQSTPELAEKRVDQIIAVAGGGRLREAAEAGATGNMSVAPA